MKRIIIVAALAAGAVAAQGQAIGPNLMANGTFDNGLDGWKSKYDKPGESWYFDNAGNVSVIPADGGQKNVLQLRVKPSVAGTQGTKVDSQPVAIDPKGKYKLTLKARADGCDCRILFEGYKWKPGIKPHPNPDLSELRRCYKFEQVFFNGRQGGDFGGVKKAWSTGTTSFPQEKMSKLQQEIYDSMKFVVLHVVAIGSQGGDFYGSDQSDWSLYLDDVKLEKLK